jgi:DNA-binding NarL/FixJ family response regulator
VGAESTVRVLIVDDHDVLGSALAHALGDQDDIIAVGVAGSLARAKELIPTTAPDVILLDHRLPDGNGVDAIGDLRALRPSVAVVVLTASPAEQVMLGAIQAGASGFLSKTRSLAEVTGAVRAAAAGEAVISPELLARLRPRMQRGSTTSQTTLTEREREVLGLLAEGLTNAAIAARLVVSVHTVRNHVANLSAKLGARSKLEALSIAMREGLLPDS